MKSSHSFPILACVTVALGLGACRGKDATPETRSTEAPAPTASPSERQLPPGHPPLPAGHPNVEPAQPYDAKPSAGGLTWSSVAPLEQEQPTSSMRAAQYRVRGHDGAADAELTVFYFGAGQGGSVDENLARWIGQFDEPEGTSNKDLARIAKRELPSKLTVTTMDLTGKYTGMARPGMPAPAPQADQRALGAIVEGPQGPVFFKLVGPSATVSRAATSFDALVESIRPVD